MTSSFTGAVARFRWLVKGQVQGVGFRPTVFRLATTNHLTGFVRNSSRGVIIEGQGTQRQLRSFERDLWKHRPPLAGRIELSRTGRVPLRGENSFVVAPSEAQGDAAVEAEIAADAATCAACAAELVTSQNRRHRYALINCTSCGPRFSIVRAIPYDRCSTTMRGFEMCPACRAEYEDPADRRFHAQPIACHDCGPRLALVDPQGQPLDGDSIERARQLLRQGKIVAIKGLGGFHLAVRADDEQAVRRLRRLKARDHKPFALMTRSLQAARELVELSHVAAALMESPACPIVLAARRQGSSIAAAVAPGSHRLGVMLPYTPIHHLLVRDGDLPPLVMTSGNTSDAPLVIDNPEALRRLGGLCDAMLWHDRPIERGVDDSVVIDTGGANDSDEAPIIIRRARGYVPRPIPLPLSCDTPGLCVGAELKNAIAIVRGREAILSQHLGDLKHPEAFAVFRRTIDDFCGLYRVGFEWIAHDLHPAYLSTQHARQLAARTGAQLIGVQHHHAHAAALLAEHGLSGPALAIVCDGTGYGSDGMVWGGELLHATLIEYQPVARLRPLLLPGGDAAARDCARAALALLHQCFGDDFAHHRAARLLVSDDARRETLCRMIATGSSCARSSGAGRVFDGVAALLGICARNDFEAQAAMAVESAAATCIDAGVETQDESLFQVDGAALREVDLSPLVRRIVERREARGAEQSAGPLAALFHEQFARAWATVAIDAAARLGIRTVGLTGGVFCNVLLTRRLSDLLSEAGLKVLRHRVVPPNDGGVALGQAAVAAATLAA